MASRLRRGDPTCLVCGQADEDELHLAFLCPFSRACWLMGNLAIRSDGFTSSIELVMTELMEQVPKELWQEVVMTLWAIWRCRNDFVFQAKLPSFNSFSKYTSQIRTETLLSAQNKPLIQGISHTGHAFDPLSISSSFICHVDGSWTFGWMGGVGLVLTNNSILMGYKSERVMACCPLQAEAIPLQQGVDYAISLGLSECTFLTDCLNLAEICGGPYPPTEVDWRAHRESLDI